MSRSKSKGVMKWLVFLLLLITFSPVFAADDEEEKKKKEKEKPQDFYIVVEEEKLNEELSLTATKIPVKTQLVPATINVVDDTLMESQHATVLGDALRNVSGVNVQSGFGVFDFFLVRGFDSLSDGLILTDGAPEPEVTFYELYNVERVEVLKGPGAFLYGGNPLSGTVQLIRKHPLLKEDLKFQSAYGSFQSFLGALDWNTAPSKKDFAFRFNGLARGADNYRDDKENHSFAINPALTWHINSATKMTLNFELVDNESKPDSGIPIIEDASGNTEITAVPRTRSYQAPFDISDQQIYRIRADYEREFNDSFRLRNKFYYTDLDWISNGTLITGAFPNVQGGLSVFRVQQRLDDHQKLIGNQLEAETKFKTGPFYHKMLTGFEAGRLGDEFTLDVGALPPIDLLNPVETATNPPFLIPGQSRQGDARSIVWAPYVVDQIDLLKEERLKLFVGGRLDVLDFEDEVDAASSINVKQFSPLIGFVFVPRRDVSLYVSAGRAFAPPSTLVVGRRDPEESTQFEAGVKKIYRDLFSTYIAFYDLEKENIAIPDSTGVTRQTGTQTSRGIELGVSRMNARDDWNYTLSYAYNDSELKEFSELVFTGNNQFVVLDRSGNKPPFAPENILNLWVLRKINNRYRIGGGPRYVSSQFIGADNEFEIDGYLTFDAQFAYRMQNWWFSVNFKNLTDKDYETRGFGNASVIPANPFSVYFGINFEKQIANIWN